MVALELTHQPELGERWGNCQSDRLLQQNGEPLLGKVAIVR
jgi:hypothetical protein